MGLWDLLAAIPTGAKLRAENVALHEQVTLLMAQCIELRTEAANLAAKNEELDREIQALQQKIREQEKPKPPPEDLGAQAWMAK